MASENQKLNPTDDVSSTDRNHTTIDNDVNTALNEKCPAPIHTKLDKKPTVTFQLNDQDGIFPSSSDDNNYPKKLSPSPTSTASPSPFDSRSPKSSMKKTATASATKSPDAQPNIASTFMRNDSIIIRVKPGQTFTEFAPIVVESLSKNDPRLGTLGELRHHLRTGTKNQVKKFLRHNHWTSGHRIRAELWKELCREPDTDVQRTLYRDTVVKLDRINRVYPPSSNAVLCDHQLKENGKFVLMRLLRVVEHIRPDYTTIPILYPLGALFLHYMNEEDSFACIMKLLSHRHSQKFLLQTDIAMSASKRTLLILVKKHINRAYILFKKLTAAQEDKDLIPIFEDWKSWIFRDLPYSHLVRVVDCFLYEGQKVLFRVSMAIIQLWLKECGKGRSFKHSSNYTCQDISADISNFCHSIPVVAPKLLKTAFSIRNLKMSYIRRVQEKYEIKIRHRESGLTDAVSEHNIKSLMADHHFVDSTLPSKILNQDHSIEVVKMMPQRFQLKPLSRLFNLDEDGISMTRFWQKVEEYSPTILVIKTSVGEIFGAYCSAAWAERKKNNRITYFGTGETFLFKFTPEPKKYSWVHKEEFFQAADAVTLLIGGGALTIQNSLEKGSSEKCPTFDNPPLSATVDFNIEMLEVFGFLDEE